MFIFFFCVGNLSMFEGLKIPRAHAPVMAAGSSSGSDGPLISDTLPSDYPSESHSEIEDVDTRSLPVSSAGSFDNKAYVQEGYYSDEIQTAAAVVKEQPKFDVQVRVKRAPPPPPSPSLTSDAESSIARTERNLSTILEQREDSIRTVDSPLPPSKTQFSYVPELHPPPKYIQPAPVYNRILRRQQELHESQQAWDEIDTTRSLASLNTEMTDTHSLTEIVDDSHSKFVAPVPPPPPPIAPQERYIASQTVEISETLPEPPIAVYRKPEITSHVVDDVFLRTITEKKTIEDIERHKRLITEYHTRAKPMEDQHWDVTIRNYPAEMQEPPEWENFSDISSASGLTLTPKPERASMSLPPQSRVDDNKTPLFSPELVGNIGHPHPHYSSSHEIPPTETYLSTFDIPIENPEVPNWDVLIRVFKPIEEEVQTFESTETFSTLTTTDKMKWRKIITTESTLRTLLTEAVVREDFERIRHDQRYEPIFEPPKWDIIIRILAPLDKPKNGRFKKKGDWDTRSRRSSLPTLYEYDSDGGSSVRTLTNEPNVQPLNIPQRSRRTSRSSYRSEADMRSMSEMTVDFARPDNLDSQSESSSYYPGRYYEDSEPDDMRRASSLTRSLSQPSLARSASEFTERWIAPSRYDTASEFTSPETTPKSQRSTRIQPVHVPRGATMEQQQHMWQAASSRAIPGGVVASQMTSQYVETSTSFRSKDWFADNDSEASFK